MYDMKTQKCGFRTTAYYFQLSKNTRYCPCNVTMYIFLYLVILGPHYNLQKCIRVTLNHGIFSHVHVYNNIDINTAYQLVISKIDTFLWKIYNIICIKWFRKRIKLIFDFRKMILYTILLTWDDRVRISWNQINLPYFNFLSFERRILTSN